MKRTILVLALILGLAAMAGGSAAAPAAVITVMTTAPGVNADGLCSLAEAILNANNDNAGQPDCAAGAGADTIILQAGATYLFVAAFDATDDGNALPPVSSAITIQGGLATLARDTTPGTPAFRLLFVTAAGNLTLIDLAITGGHANVDGTGLGGGGIYNAGTLTLTNVTVSGNQSGTTGGGVSNRLGTTTVTGGTIANNSAANAGGGLYNRSGNVTIASSTVSGNSSTADADPAVGGGIASHAIEANTSLVLTQVTVTGNSAEGVGGGGIDNSASSNRVATVQISDSQIEFNAANGADHTEGLGGGIQNSFFRGTANASANLTIERSTLRHNTAVDGGGISNGIDLPSNLIATLTLLRSAVYGNTTSGTGFVVGSGGGIYNVNGVATIANSTISGNVAGGSGGPTDFSGHGGGILAVALNGPSTVSLINSTVAFNTAATRGGGVAGLAFSQPGDVRFNNSLVGANVAPTNASCFNFGGTLTSLGHNLEDLNTCGFNQGSDLPNTSPLLGMGLLNHGGPTPSHALLPGSPAINAADNAVCAAAPVHGVDQRGVVRPQGAVCDIGAYEANWATTVRAYTTQYFLNNGTSGSGRYALLAGGQYVDEIGHTGTWTFQTGPPRFTFIAAPGTNCDLRAVGRFISATQLYGSRVCQDGSGLAGVWLGTQVPVAR